MATPSCCFSLAGVCIPKRSFYQDRLGTDMVKTHENSIIIRSLWLLSWLFLLVLPPTVPLARVLACLLMAASATALLPCRGRAHARQLSTAPRSHSFSLSSCFVFRSCALCLVERPQNADCSDETGVVMPAPPPPPATTVRALRPVCAQLLRYYILRSLGSSSLFSAWAHEGAFCASLSCALCVLCVYCLRANC